jgi:hypothetical protein
MKIEDYNKYYIQGSDHYLIPKDVFKELFNEMINWKQQCKKQKEVINKLSKIIYEIDDLRKTTGGYPSHYLDELLDILKEVSE